MKDLLETSISIAFGILLIAATYSYLGAWLTGLITEQFDKVVP